MYEPLTINFIGHCAKHVKHLSSKVMLDVGANTGLFTILTAGMFSSVYSFEPFPPLFRRLEDHVSINNCRNVKLFPFGLGSSNGLLPFLPPGGGNTGTGYFSLDPSSSDCFLEVKRGDEVIEANIDRVGFIKIDVEGFEPFVLEGLSRTLKENRPIIYMELNRKTRAVFGSQKNLMELLPHDYIAMMVKKRLGSLLFFPLEWDQKKSNNVALVPKEILSELTHRW